MHPDVERAFKQLEPQFLEVVVRAGLRDRQRLLADFDVQKFTRQDHADKVVVEIPLWHNMGIARLRQELDDTNIYVGLMYKAEPDQRVVVYDANGDPVSRYKCTDGDYKWVKQCLYIARTSEGRGYVAGWKLNLKNSPVCSNLVLLSYDLEQSFDLRNTLMLGERRLADMFHS